MIKVGIDDKQFNTAIQKLVKEIKMPANMFKVILPILRRDVLQHFRDETGETGKWASLSKVTLARRREGKKAGSPRILQDTGVLRGSFQTGVEGLQRAIAFIGTPLKYATTHQLGARKGEYGRTKFGAPIPWGDVPIRTFLWLSEDGKQSILDLCKEYIKNRWL